MARSDDDHVDTSTGIVGFDLLPMFGLSPEDIAKAPPYSGPPEVPEGCVVVDFSSECSLCDGYISDNGGYVVDEETWRIYAEGAKLVAELAEKITMQPLIPGWVQRGEPEPWSRSIIPGLLPQLVPLRNRIPRALKADDGA